MIGNAWLRELVNNTVSRQSRGYLKIQSGTWRQKEGNKRDHDTRFNVETATSIWGRKTRSIAIRRKNRTERPNRPNKENGAHQTLRETLSEIYSGNMLPNSACWDDRIRRLPIEFLRNRISRRQRKTAILDTAGSCPTLQRIPKTIKSG